jgi:hypothetical protein
MEAWWNTLGTPLQVYYGIAIVTTFLLFLQLLLSLIGLDHDVDGFDLGDVADAHDSGVSVVSIRSVLAFFTGFGWGGVVSLRQGLTVFAATVVATVAGVALTAMVVGLMRALYGMRYSGTLDYTNAIGVVGNVYLPIPGAMQGPGQVEVLVQGRLAVVQAFTRSPERIPNRTRVKVVDTLDQQTLLVEPLQPVAPSGKES